MAGEDIDEITRVSEGPSHHVPEENGRAKRRVDWKAMLGNRNKNALGHPSNRTSTSDLEQQIEKRPARWGMGILNDRETEEVPGSILLLSKVSEYNEPLGLRNAPARNSASSLPSPYPPSIRSSFSRRRPFIPEKKRTPDGKIILEPQPDDSLNDPLNWEMWRRDLALLSLGFYCMVGGGMTPILAAGFNDVAEEFDVGVPQVALTTGLYMMGLGVGSALLSPTAILFGKRPVYLCAAILYILTSIWCALAPNFANLVVARIFMGIAVSSVECLPSATVAEIFFLHEKAYRLGIYTLLLLGGKNLMPLISAAVIQSLHWRWVFWIVAIVVGFCLCLLFVFVPETFWDRTPRPHKHQQGLHRLPSRLSIFRTNSIAQSPTEMRKPSHATLDHEQIEASQDKVASAELKTTQRHAHFQTEEEVQDEKSGSSDEIPTETDTTETKRSPQSDETTKAGDQAKSDNHGQDPLRIEIPPPVHSTSHASSEYFDSQHATSTTQHPRTPSDAPSISRVPTEPDQLAPTKSPNPYTEFHRAQPPRTFKQQLRPYSGRLSKDNWFRVAARPFVLFCYPSILWSTLVYSLSVGWLIVLSESVAAIYQNRESYNFDSLQTGLVYISPFVGGILGTAVAGKVSDQVVRYLSRKNGGIYEPEFRLVMGIPIAIFTTIGLMGYGWSAQERDRWIVPTVFFGFISFGCSLGSTTAITFAVDSYRQYAGEALVTLNFSKNILHGLVFSLFFNRWLEAEGSKDVFIAIGGIQMACLLTTIPMYVYGKRARMWTVRKNLLKDRI